MKLLRNPEVKRQVLGLAICSFTLIVIGFGLGMTCGIYTVIVCAFYILCYFLWTAWRYRKIASLSAKVDQVLHVGGILTFGESLEGEMSILESELSKMTIRLQEQAETLRRDKQYLTDSIADISHQLKTPLTSMGLIASFLQKEEISASRRMELVGELNTLLSRMDFLITVLLKMAKIDAGTAEFKREPIEVKTLIQEAAAPLLIPMELREQILSTKGKEDVTFTGDLSWSVEAVGNVLKNCMEHTPKGGTICIEYEENPLYTQIKITDSGPGIDQEDLPHLFERFYKGKLASESSVGIGLALSRLILSQQNGTIKAENSPTGGAKFLIRFYKGTV